MSILQAHYFKLLEQTLARDFVPNIPPLLDLTRPPEEQYRKNLSRAFSAFALHRICDIGRCEACQSVIDDFDDYGVDAIYYHGASETLYLVQTKLKESEQFSQKEALAFGQGARKLFKQDFSGFNQNVQNRKNEIEGALDDCRAIRLVVAHIGAGISKHARTTIQELLDDETHGEERLVKEIVDYDTARVVHDLQTLNAYECVNTDIWLDKCQSIQEPRTTYFGLAKLEALVTLHERYGKALYERNIRTFLGHKTDVNSSIRQTLEDKPEEFLYLNNGVAALCDQIEPKGTKKSQGGQKRLCIRGFSVINGAQTIASAARFMSDNPNAGLSNARVSITLIKATTDGEFGKSVTRARNHQNPVSLADFVAQDDEQERLRRELAYLDICYVYKAEVMENKFDPLRIQVDEAAQALALFQKDPRFVVWLKKEPGRLLDPATDQYKALFPATLSPFELINAVRFLRYVQSRMMTEVQVATGQERLAYKYGDYALGWVLAKRVKVDQQAARLFDDAKLKAQLGAPMDNLRQTLWMETQRVALHKGPLALFKNQGDVVSLLTAMLIQDYELVGDAVVAIKQNKQKGGQPYPIDLFDYLISKAPQIGNLS